MAILQFWYAFVLFGLYGGVLFLCFFRCVSLGILVEHGNDPGLKDIIQSGIEGR